MATSSVSLRELIKAGYIDPPFHLEKEYRGTKLCAKVLSDGRVEFQGSIYNSLSGAAANAKKQVSGRDLRANGWMFWNFRDPGTGDLTRFDRLRDAYLEKKS